jgi:amino acid adenylation domain-containing protein
MTVEVLQEPSQSAPLHALAGYWAEATPEAPAVVGTDGSYSYRQLWQRSRDVAALLRERGATPGDVVATRLPRSADQIIALLGVLRAGCTVMPVETSAPPDRVATLLADANARLVLVGPGEPLPAGDWEALPMPGVPPSPASLDAGPVPLSAPACVLYTSGSTGRPKGVLLSHEALIRYGRGQARHLRITSSDRIAQRAPFSTDAALFELIFAFSTGAATVILPSEALALPEVFVARMTGQRISVLTIVPSLLRMLLDDEVLSRCPDLRAVASFGEQLTAALATEFARQSDASLFNLYGPTEVGIGATAYQVTGAETGSAVPIGPVVAPARGYVCGPDGVPVPDGEPGELYVGGEQLAYGYLHHTGITAIRFVADAHSGIPGARLYRTGDLVIREPGGALCYLGRQDDQIKLRGVRIEPAEIEVAIRLHPDVREAAVVATPASDRDRTPVLTAFVVSASPAPELGRAVRAHLRGLLPAPLVPAFFEFPATLPLLANGKVDRPRLRSLAAAGRSTEDRPVVPASR